MIDTSDLDRHRLTKKRTDDNICARCRKPIEVGHRITPAYIVTDPRARNPNNALEKGLELGTDLEFAHVDCKDPHLTGRHVG